MSPELGLGDKRLRACALECARIFIIDIAFGEPKNNYTILPEVIRAVFPPSLSAID